MPNAPAIIELLIAAGMVGATLVPINTRFRSRELAHVISESELRVLFTTDVIDEHVNFTALLHEALPGLADAADPARAGAARHAELRAVVLVGERGAPGLFERRPSCASGPPWSMPPAGATARGPTTIALLLYTSGTTAASQGLHAHPSRDPARRVRHRRALCDRPRGSAGGIRCRCSTPAR